MITAVAVMAAISAQSAIIMDATTLNGSFENGWGTGTTRDFNDVGGVANWFNIGSGGQTATCAADTLAALPATGYNAVVADYNLSGAVLHSANTGYAIQSGDSFNISFDWRDASGWEANDQIRVAVVAYDNDSATTGTQVMRMWVSDKVTTAATWESVSGTTAVVDQAVVGRTLFIQAYGVNGGAGTGDFARVDNIVVEQIPEPATLGLVVAFGGGILFIRRKFML